MNRPKNADELVTVGGAARILQLSPDRVRDLEREGVLQARRAGAVRVFSRESVERLAEQRAQRASRGAR